ncbi:hypothetical protein NL676_029162 [Syzygium grande]|nr:hypothetical protein NL676_029162 [Syzygium grande]
MAIARPLPWLLDLAIAQIQAGTKIVAVGHNYTAHAKELGNAVPKEPMLFLKPTSSYLENGGTIEVPAPQLSLDHEVELAVVIGRKARDVPESAAMDYVGGYALGLDMTAREIQSSAKSIGLPWTVAKGQDTFTPISNSEEASHPTSDLLTWSETPPPHDSVAPGSASSRSNARSHQGMMLLAFGWDQQGGVWRSK